MKKNKKLQLWFVWPVRIVLALVAIGLLLASLYINSEPMQKRVKNIIAQKTGDIVSFERANFSFFPRPGFAFSPVKINIPAGGSIRMAAAEIYPQMLPLFVGEIRIAKIRFVEPNIFLDISDKPKQSALNDKPSSPAEFIDNVTSVISSIRLAEPDMVAVIKRGKLIVREDNVDVAAVHNIYARVAFEPGEVEIKFKGDADKWGGFSVRGNVRTEKNSVLVGDGLSMNTIILKNVQAAAFDSSFLATVAIAQTPQAVYSVDLTLSGGIGPKTLQWISKTFSLPPEQTLRAPISLSNAHVIWQAGEKLAITAKAAIEDGPMISVVLNKNAADLAISELKISDKESQANIAFTYARDRLDFSFQGNLTEKTLNRIFEHSSFHRGWIKGDFRAHVRLDQYLKSTAQGHIEGADFIIPLPMDDPLKVRRAVLNADNKTLKVESAVLNWGENNFELKGNINAAKDGLRLDLDLSSDAILVETIKKRLSLPAKKDETKFRGKLYPLPALRGIINVHAPSITWGHYTAEPFQVAIVLTNNAIKVDITEAFICGIAVPGNIIFGKNDVAFDFKAFAAGRELEPILNCLFHEDSRITGILNLKAAVNSRGKSDALLSSLQGRVEFLSKDGIIYHFPLLAKIFSFLNVTELLRGKIPDFGTEGFKYNSITIKGNIRQGIFLIQEAVIDGTTMQLAGEGEINLVNNKIDLTVLVAPFKTVDFLVSKIPLVGYVLKGTLISIPLRVTGDLADPDITALSVTAVGEGLLGMMKRTLSLPVKIIEPIIPRDKKEEK